MTRFTRSELLPWIGDLSQVGGLRRYELSEGRAKGVAAVDVRTGAGLCFTVLPDRCLDIAWAEYKSIGLTHIGKVGVAGPQYYEKDQRGWLRTFFAGLLTTCGLSNVGGPCEDEADPFGIDNVRGLHGRISTTPAEDVSISQRWVGEHFEMKLAGRMRQANFAAEHLVLTREITARLGENRFRIHDTIENLSFQPVPLMFLYHFNFGYPFLDEGVQFVSDSASVIPRNEPANQGLARHADYGPPADLYPEQIFHHDLTPGADGRCTVGLVNRKLGLAVYLKFLKEQLPHFTQWKMLQRGDYVTGLEPGNCWPEGCNEARRNGRLETLEPGQAREFVIEYGVLEGMAALNGLGQSGAE